MFGYLPYWRSTEYLRYDLLTHLACFSVEINGDGTLGDDHGWPWTGVINEAHAAGVKVVLVATLFDGDAVEGLITDPTATQTFLVNIRDKMLEGDADGLNIDFEEGTKWQGRVNAFMSELTDYLHAEIPGSEVTIAGPAVNWDDIWDLSGLAASCDGIFIMGYNFNGSWSSRSGPNAPLTDGSINVTDTVLEQYAAVVRDNPEKLILGVPYYGQHWTTQSSDARSEVIDWIDSPLFEAAQPASLTYGVIWDDQSQTPWYLRLEGATWHQVWFDNEVSLGLKYDLAEANRLQGVGMWALGYDGPRGELWDLLSERFTDCALLDEDGDGIDEEDDRCPGTASGAEIDERGCACDQLDDDEDGITDCDDTCPDTAVGASVDTNGCATTSPDADADGVSDTDDDCPDTPSGQDVDADGCTDFQRDGDSDEDGIADLVDACPDSPAGQSVDDRGCNHAQIDADGDGIFDTSDQCLGTAAGETTDDRGCSATQLVGAPEQPADDVTARAGGGRVGAGGVCGAGLVPALLLMLVFPRVRLTSAVARP
ncbi:MAG: hypothetical protein GY778_28275 [bacterium]|nr:hypothetical protein [bacterium]